MRTRAPDASAPGAAEFDGVYLAGRRRLVLEAYALTGDLSAARGAVRDAFVAAAHHWRTVGRLPDPEEWVRPRAWATAQRRHAGRPWHREPGLDGDQRAVLDALHRLPDHQRKVLLLGELAGLSTEAVGRELGTATARVQQQRAVAVTAFCRATGTAPDAVAAAVESLAPLAEGAALPPAAVVRRDGRRRRRRHTVAGVAAIVALTLLGGLFVVDGGARAPADAGDRVGPLPHPVTAAMMLDPAQVARLSDQRWELRSTTDNTGGTGINSVCQAGRFADPRGRGTFVRTYSTADVPRRRLVQTIEISRTRQAAVAAYATTLGWFAGCQQARLQLLRAYRVRGLGDQAQLLELRIPGAVRRTYLVGVARTGSLTLSTVLETAGGTQVEAARGATALADAVRNVCATDASSGCPSSVSVDPVLPPRSGEPPGTLAAGDLPVVGQVDRPWVGTAPVPARVNVAATTCDRADFVRGGAAGARTRTFLIPQARLSRRFGITETYGAFASPAAARAFLERVRTAMAGCEKRDLGATVSQSVTEQRGFRGSQYALWRLDSEIRPRTTVGFWMGVVRAGRYVAQVNFTPVGSDDVDAGTFQALVTRARDRLFELPGSTPGEVRDSGGTTGPPSARVRQQ